MKSEGIDLSSPNADRNIRQGLPIFTRKMKEELTGLESSDPQSAEYMRRQGAVTPRDLVARLEALEQYLGRSGASGSWDNRGGGGDDMVDVSAPDGQTYRVHRGRLGRIGASGKW